MAASTTVEKLQVIWSPNNENEFATYGSELRVYKYLPTVDEDNSFISSDIQLSSESFGKLISVSTEVSCSPTYQTVAWRPSKDEHTHCFAVGQKNGKVSLINLLSKQLLINSHGFQLSPKTLGRPCNCIAWNYNDNRLLAEGLEKTRSDSSLIVWDINQATGSGNHDKTKTSSSFRNMDSTNSDDRSKFFETGHGENTSSIAWLQETTLVAGMGSRYLKVFDIREDNIAMQTSGPREYAQHKGIFGLSVDPSFNYQLASYAEGNNVYMWDTRMFQKPLYSFSRPGNINHLSWLTTRSGCLSVVFSESPFLRLINIPYLLNSTEMSEGYLEYLNSHVNDRFPLYKKSSNNKCTVMSLDWHSSWQNKGLIVNNEGVVQEITVWDKIPLSWSCSSSIIYSRSEDSVTVSCDKILESWNDISIVMKQRVLAGYGFNISKNIEITKEDSTLCSVWMWLNEQISSSSDSKRSLHGVSDILDNICDSIQTNPAANCPPFPVYSSPKRANALDLCGWNFANQTELLDGFLRREESLGRYERASTIAVFQGDLTKANSSLRRGANDAMKKDDNLRGSLYNLIALSLSGYSPNEPSLWQETCLLIKTQINNPYLRAMFTFLSATSSSDEDFKDILADSSLLLQDRVAFALMYLDDVQLKKNLEILKKKVVNDGLIEGVFLTGLSDDGILLIANYVNKTGDVQTACYIAGQILPTRNITVQTWFEGYRDLLDQWKLWKERAQFDHNRKLLDPTYKPLRNTSIVCVFCSKGLSSDILRQDRLKGSAKKSTSCPSCRKPLPRCALCLLHMAAGNNKGKDHSNQFGQWFSWCQTCRHGGHAIHMTEWFETHRVCPVTDCNCHCLSLDSTAASINE